MKIQIGGKWLRGLGKRIKNPKKKRKDDDKPVMISTPPILTNNPSEAHEYEHFYQAQLERDDVLEFHSNACITP